MSLTHCLGCGILVWSFVEFCIHMPLIFIIILQISICYTASSKRKKDRHRFFWRTAFTIHVNCIIENLCIAFSAEVNLCTNIAQPMRFANVRLAMVVVLIFTTTFNKNHEKLKIIVILFANKNLSRAWIYDCVCFTITEKVRY